MIECTYHVFVSDLIHFDSFLLLSELTYRLVECSIRLLISSRRLEKGIAREWYVIETSFELPLESPIWINKNGKVTYPDFLYIGSNF